MKIGLLDSRVRPSGVEQFFFRQNVAWTLQERLEHTHSPLTDMQRVAFAQQSAVGAVAAEWTKDQRRLFHDPA